MHDGGNELTVPPLLDLERRQCEDTQYLDHNLDQNSLHGSRDLSENTQATEVVFQTFE